MTDTTTPLCSWAEFAVGPFANLARYYTDEGVQADLAMEATREAESIADGRRLAPFTGLTETHRADGVDPDEYTDSANLPLDIIGELGRSYAMSLGASTLVRHCWLNEYAPRFADMWAYSDTVTVDITRSYGGGQTLSRGQFAGPYPDSGHIWFNLGLFIPIGSYVQIQYGGGYAPVPADLRRAAKYLLGAIVVRELQPNPTHPDPEALVKAATRILRRYGRGGDRDGH